MSQEQRGPRQPQPEPQAKEQAKATKDPHALQSRWLWAAKGKRIRVWFLGDTGVQKLPTDLRGILIGADQYTIALKDDKGNVYLIYKSAIAMMLREEGAEP